MRKLCCSLIFILVFKTAFCQQQPRLVDSVQQLLAKSTSFEDKFRHTAYLARLMMTVNPQAADQYGQQLIALAENSGDKSRIIEAFLINGDRYGYLAGRKDNIVKSITSYNKALELSQKYKMDTTTVRALLALSAVNRSLPDYNKALNYCNQAFSFSSHIDNDSIATKVDLEFGNVYLGKNDKIQALRKFLSAARTAEKLKSVILKRNAYSSLSTFYAVIGDNKKAINKEIESLHQLERIATQPGIVYEIIAEYNKIGGLYTLDKNYDTGRYYFERSLKIADSVKYEPIKAMAYSNIIRNYLAADQPQKALDYFNAHPQLKEFLKRINFGHFIDQSYGRIYLRLGNYDSAKYYYGQAASFYEKDVNRSNQYDYYFQLGTLYLKTGETGRSQQYFLKAKAIADSIGSLDQVSEVVENLDTLARREGDFKQAYLYAALNMKFKDSLNKQRKEKEMMQIEATDEQQRIEQQIKEQEELKKRRNNIQYIGIVFGLVILFITLVVLGMFKVPAGLIKAIGFFVFLMLFEFIFLVFKKNIYSITHGEPWKDLAFMIALAALLVPLHHWLEHKVLHYLTSHNRLTAAGHHIRRKLFRRTNQGEL